MDIATMAMQQLATQAAANDVVGNVSGKQSFQDAQASTQGGFSSMLQMLLQNGAGTNGEQVVAQLLVKEGEKNAQAMAAAMLAQNPLLAALLAKNGFSGEGAEEIMASALQSGTTFRFLQGLTGENSVQTLETLQGAKNALTQEQLEQPSVQSTVNGAKNVENMFTLLQEKESGKAMPENAAIAQQLNVSVENGKGDAKLNTQQEIFEKMSLDTAAARARVVNVQTSNEGEAAQNGETAAKEKAEGTKPETSKAENTESAMQQAAFGKTLESAKQAATETNTAKPEAAREIVRQTADGIKQNIAAGKDEFVMKLKPEGLGEITVKLETINGKVTMQLTAQNQSVQRLLSNELEALREAVRPYNVEVRELGGGNNASLDMNMNSQKQDAQQQLYSQMNGAFNFSNGNNRGQQSFESFITGDEEDVSDISAIPIMQKLSSALNAYI